MGSPMMYLAVWNMHNGVYCPIGLTKWMGGGRFGWNVWIVK